ncbi:MAG: creatininase family protein [Elusimicrobia bacterium]|nr:creatininase family protein [Elusimicrobiota bacterium]
MAKGAFLESMTWLKAERALKRHPVLLLPLGARAKEHGPHLPLNNDWILAERLTALVMKKAQVLVLPGLAYSHYPAFVEYPGSASLSPATSCATVVEICRSFAAHGARKFYVLNTGISTRKILEEARQTLSQDGVTLGYTDLGALSSIEAQVRESAGGTHADEIETSMMLYLAPEIVRMKLARKDFHTGKGPGGLTRDPNARCGVYSPTGAWGDPTLASRKKGRIVVQALVKQIIEDIRRIQLSDFSRRE